MGGPFMPVTQDRLTRLREFGLSEYAARSYLALLDLGIAEARDVSSISKVPQAKIYHVLEQLHDKGLVVILPEFPKKYAPVPFEEYLGRLYDEHTKAAKAIEDERAELAEMFRVMGDTDVGDRGFFTVIRGRRNVLSKVEEMIGQTQKDLIVLGTSGTASRASHMLPELRRARERGVRVRMLAPVDPETVEKLAPIAEVSELRARELGDEEQSAKVAIVVSDSSRAFLMHFVPDDANLYTGKDIGVFTDQEAMVAAIQAIVEPHWTRSPRYEQRKGEILHGLTPEFTRVYGNDADAREALALALRNGPKEVLLVTGLALDEHGSPDLALAGRKHAKGAHWRVLVDIRAADDAAACATMAKGESGLEIRHARMPTFTRQLVIDSTEVFCAIGNGDGHSEVVIHTNAPAVVKALRNHFERAWALGPTLEERRKELEIFPGLQPNDVGIGRLFHLLRDAVVVADARDTIALWNPAAAATFERDATHVYGMPIAELIAADARKAFLDRMHRFRERNAPNQDADFFETEGARPGERFPMEVTLSLLRTAEDDRYVVAVVRDITMRKRAQAAERDANLRIQRAYERMTEAFYALDRDWRFVYRNPVVRAMQRALGTRTDEEIDGSVIWKTFPDLAGTKFETELKRAMNDQKPVKFVDHYARLGRWFEVAAYPSEEGLSVYYRDVTQDHQSRSLLKATLEATPDGILVISRDERITGYNEKFREMWRIPRDLLEQGADEQAIAFVLDQLDEPGKFERKVRDLYEHPDAESHDILRFKDGRVFERFSKPQRVDGEVVGRVWSFRDVTPAKKA